MPAARASSVDEYNYDCFGYPAPRVRESFRKLPPEIERHRERGVMNFPRFHHSVYDSYARLITASELRLRQLLFSVLKLSQRTVKVCCCCYRRLPTRLKWFTKSVVLMISRWSWETLFCQTIVFAAFLHPRYGCSQFKMSRDVSGLNFSTLWPSYWVYSTKKNQDLLDFIDKKEVWWKNDKDDGDDTPRPHLSEQN